VVVENVSGQFYLDWMAGNAEILKIAAGDVISGFAPIRWRVIDCHAGNNAICREHVRDIQSFNHGPGVGSMHAVAVIETAADFRVSIFERDKAINVVRWGAS
jgi:hypothetical protein